MLTRALLCVLVLPALISAACYAPDGSLSRDVPCNPTAAVSICCTAGFYCLSNFLCSKDAWYEKGYNRYIRGTCTDKTWSDPACGNHCTNENKSGGEWVMQCDGGSDTENPTWCCANDQCCDKPTGKFHMANGTLLDIARDMNSASSSAVPSDTSSMPTTSTNAAGQPTNVEPPPSSEAGNRSNNVALGVGVGIAEGVGVVIVVAGGIWLWLWLKRRRQAKRGPAKNYEDKEIEAAQTGYLNELEGKNRIYKEQYNYELEHSNSVAELPVT